MRRQADMSVWQGRIDGKEGALAKRWHQVVSDVPKDHGVSLLGFVCDEGIRRNQGRVGAALAPAAIRKALANLAWHGERSLCDAGDVVCVDGELEIAQSELAHAVQQALERQQLPVVLGGGHEVAFGSWSGLAAHALKQSQLPRIGVLNFDAHFDLRTASQANSGTPFQQIAEVCKARNWPFSYACLGVAEASNTGALFERAHALKVHYVLDHQLLAEPKRTYSELQAWLESIDWLHLSFCLDVLPAAQAPGVSAPAALGVGIEHLLPLLTLARESGKLKLAELAELSPPFDQDARTAKLAARLVFEFVGTQFNAPTRSIGQFHG